MSDARSRNNRGLSTGQVWYRQVYLRSRHWRWIKARKFKEQKRCEVCGEKRHLDVHHASYSNLWHESLRELIVLCRPCHAREHSNISDFEKIERARVLMERAQFSKRDLCKIIHGPGGKPRIRKGAKFSAYAYHCLRMVRKGLASEDERAFIRANQHAISRLPI